MIHSTDQSDPVDKPTGVSDEMKRSQHMTSPIVSNPEPLTKDASAPDDGASKPVPSNNDPISPAQTESPKMTNMDLRSTKQHTLAKPAVIEGVGLFLSESVTCTILPAEEDHGIVFERVDLSVNVQVPAFIAHVTNRDRRSTLKAGAAAVETCEHCLSALAGLGVDNALIQLTGPELPCGDGSAQPYVQAIIESGLVAQEAERRVHRITEPITIEDGQSMLAALPSDGEGLQILYDLDYGDDSPISRQSRAFSVQTNGYVEQVAPARTFSLEEEAKALWDSGMCHHLTPKDILVIGNDGPIDNSYRFEDEPVRHKILDLIGDLSLLGRRLQGRIVAYRSGHALNHNLVNRLLEQMRSQERTDIAGRRPKMDIRNILSLLRHRYPMLLIDRVIEIEGDRRAIGVKNVTFNEPFFQGHYPGAPIMPGVLIVEAMAQLSGLLVSNVLEHKGKIPILLSMDKVKLRRPVVPGDQLVIEAETIHAKSRTANINCKAFVAGQLTAEARIKFILVDEEQD